MTIKSSLKLLALGVAVAACGEGGGPRGDLKAQLSKKKQELAALKDEIRALEEEISRKDPDFQSSPKRATLVTTVPARKDTFVNFVEVSGSVASRTNVNVSPETSGRLVKVMVTEGDFVKAGQKIAQIDDEVLRNNIAEIETRLDLARTIYEKRKRLWAQKIGSEVQYLEAKNNVESLESSLATTKTMLSKTIVRAPFAGKVDELYANTGEMAGAGVPLIRLVSLASLYVKAEVSESHIESIKPGHIARLTFPTTGASLLGRVSSVGAALNPVNRTFEIEIQLPGGNPLVKPNMVVNVRLKTFEQQDVVVAPTNLVQDDNRGKFIFVVAEEKGLKVAKKVRIEPGRSTMKTTVVKTGLKGGEQIISEGFREVVDGGPVNVTELPELN